MLLSVDYSRYVLLILAVGTLPTPVEVSVQIVVIPAMLVFSIRRDLATI